MTSFPNFEKKMGSGHVDRPARRGARMYLPSILNHLTMMYAHVYLVPNQVLNSYWLFNSIHRIYGVASPTYPTILLLHYHICMTWLAVTEASTLTHLITTLESITTKLL